MSKLRHFGLEQLSLARLHLCQQRPSYDFVLTRTRLDIYVHKRPLTSLHANLRRWVETLRFSSSEWPGRWVGVDTSYIRVLLLLVVVRQKELLPLVMIAWTRSAGQHCRI